MTSEWEGFGLRVREARFARQMEQSELAARLGLERSVVSKIERGARRVSAIELAALARALSVPLVHFLEETPAAMVSNRDALDAPASESERLRFDADVQLHSQLSDVQQIRGLGLLPSAEVVLGETVADQEGAVRLATSARRLMRNPVGPLPAMADVAARFGLWIVVVDGAVEGASITPEQGFGVGVVGDRAEPGRRRFTAAHELGHHLIGDAYASDVGVSASRSEREQVIDAFAATLLLPDAAVGQFLERQDLPLYHRLVMLAATYRVSWSVVTRSALRVAPKLLAEPLRQATRRWPTRADFIEVTGGDVAPDLGLGATAGAWKQAVLAAHDRSLITASRAVELLYGAVAADDLVDRDDS